MGFNDLMYNLHVLVIMLFVHKSKVMLFVRGCLYTCDIDCPFIVPFTPPPLPLRKADHEFEPPGAVVHIF